MSSDPESPVLSALNYKYHNLCFWFSSTLAWKTALQARRWYIAFTLRIADDGFLNFVLTFYACSHFNVGDGYVSIKKKTQFFNTICRIHSINKQKCRDVTFSFLIKRKEHFTMIYCWFEICKEIWMWIWIFLRIRAPAFFRLLRSSRADCDCPRSNSGLFVKRL